MVVNVYNKYDLPFGVFSLDYFDLNVKTYKSVLHRILYKKLNSRRITKYRDNVLREAIKSKIKDVVILSVEKFIDFKCKNDIQFKNLLSSTKNKIIFYLDENIFLGKFNSVGANVYGLMLQNYRDEHLFKSRFQNSKEERVILINSASSYLSLKYDKIITLENFNFPTCEHYIYFKILLEICKNPNEAYNFIYRGDRFVDITEVTKNITSNIENMINEYLIFVIREGYNERIKYNNYILDYLKCVEDKICVKDYESEIVSSFLNKLNETVDIKIMLNVKGDVINYINEDSFFQQFSSVIFYNLLEIYKVLSLKNSDFQTIFENFFNVDKQIKIQNHTLKNIVILKLCKEYGYSFENINNIIISYLLFYESTKPEKSNEIFWTKKNIVDSFYKTYSNMKINSEYYALKFLSLKICMLNDRLKPNLSDIRKSFSILNNSPNLIHFSEKGNTDTYFNQKVKELKNSKKKNIYRINYYSGLLE